MPITVLAALVVFGIAGVAMLTILFGFGERRKFTDTDDARAAWLREFPDLPPSKVSLSQDGCHALIRTEHGAGIVWSMGADSSARLVQGARITDTAKGLDLRMADITAPRIRPILTPQDRINWRNWIEDHT